MTSFDRERYRTRTATKNTQPDNFEFVLCTVHSGRVQGSEYCVVHSAQWESTGVRVQCCAQCTVGEYRGQTVMSDNCSAHCYICEECRLKSANYGLLQGLTLDGKNLLFSPRWISREVSVTPD